MSLRMLEGEAKKKYYEIKNEPQPLSLEHDQILKSSSSGPQNCILYRSLTLDGAVESRVTKNMAVDGSITTQRFLTAPPPGQTYIITRALVVIRDSGTFDSGGWGNRVDPLVIGCQPGFTINGQDINFTGAWRAHTDLALCAYDVTHHNFGQGDEFLATRLSFFKSGTNIRLVGDNGDSIWMDIQDDLTYLVGQGVMMNGFIEECYLG